MLVMPPGIAGVILSLHRCCFVLSVLGQQKESSTNRLFSDSTGLDQTTDPRLYHLVLDQLFVHPSPFSVSDDDTLWKIFLT